MMHDTPDNLHALRQRIDQPASSDELVHAIDEISRYLSDKEDARELYQLLVDAFQSLRVLTVGDVRQGEQAIRNRLLDYLEQDSHGSAIQRQLRECLTDWLEQYPDRERVALRARILDDLLRRFQVRPSSSICWTFSHIGYRQERVVEALWNCARQDAGDLGDAALVTLTALGVPKGERPALLRMVQARMVQHVSQPLLVALSRLPDPASIPIVGSSCFPLEHAGEVNREQLLALTALAGIADAFDSTGDIQDQVWRLIAELYEQGPRDVVYYVNLGGDIASRCDSGLVVPTLLTWLGQVTDEEKRNERIPLLYYRLEECLRPRQLESWQQSRNEAALSVLQQSACLDTRFEGRFATREMHEKEAAWGIVFRTGYEGALDWFEQAVSAETNRYVRKELCDLFACFRLHPLPPDVLTWIKELYDAKSSDISSAELVARLGAVEVAHSAASLQAFEALLGCGLTYEGQQLLAPVEALADVACVLTREGNSGVVDTLVQTAVHHPTSSRRIVAGRALASLAAEDLLPSSSVAPLIEALLMQEGRDPYEQSYLVAALVPVDALPAALMTRLKQWALERDDLLAIQSFAALAQRDALLPEEDLLQRLGLRREAETGEITAVATRLDWQAQAIGLLYQHHPEALAPAVAQLIASLPWASAVQIMRKLDRASSDSERPPLSQKLADALIQRIQQRQTRTSAELALLSLASNLMPERMAMERWDDIWNDWLPDARGALAEVLGAAEVIASEAKANAVRLLLLLTADGQYGVRRSAYRGLVRRASDLLRLQCWAWAESDQRELRQRAAEAWAWLSESDGQDGAYEDLYQALISDPEPVVRQTVVRTQQERRKRLWGQAYLHRVLEGSESSNTHILSVWCYAEALKRVGDDSTLQALRTALGNRLLPPHIRYWYQLILKETTEGWQKAMKKWPQPGKMWAGTIEEGSGLLVTGQGEAIPVRYSLWGEAPDPPLLVGSWGGTMQIQESRFSFDEGILHLQLTDERHGEILLKERSLPGGYCSFVGQGPYPH